MILIFSTNTNCESMAYRSFRPSGFEARGVRKVTTGIKVSPQKVSCLFQATPSSTRLRSGEAADAIEQHSWMRGTLVTPSVPSACGDSQACSSHGRAGNNPKARGNPQPTRPSLSHERKSRGSTLAKVWVRLLQKVGLRYGLLPPERVRQATGCTSRESGGGDQRSPR